MESASWTRYRWGLIPSWAKDASIGSKTINTRDDQLLAEPNWKRLLSRRRLLIPADGFYEWLQRDKKKYPIHFKFRDGRVFSFAGLLDEWENPEGEKIRSCTITTEANGVVGPLHGRMPVILPPEARSVAGPGPIHRRPDPAPETR
jgi:putative SOS response-associated peptidase YedK